MRPFPAPVGLHFGSPAIPAQPTISSIVDNGDGVSVTVTVVGTGSIQLYYRIKNASDWIVGGNRTGSGVIVQGGLTAGTWYEFYIVDTVNRIESPPSLIFVVRVLDSDDTTIETAIVAILVGDSTVASLIDERVYPNLIPQTGSIPAITYQQLSGPRDHTMDGASCLVKSVYQIISWAKTYADAKELSEAARGALDAFSGTVNSVEIEVMHLSNEGDMPSINADTEELYRYGKRLDLMIWYKEA